MQKTMLMENSYKMTFQNKRSLLRGFRRAIFHCVLLFLPGALFPAPAINGNPIDSGKYIGESIVCLNERKLFEILAPLWNIPPEFQEKLLSGSLHSDNRIGLEFSGTEEGYKAIIHSKSGREERDIVQWGAADLLTHEKELPFRRSTRKVLFLNFVPHAYWLRFDIENLDEQEITLLLELDEHFSPKFDVFLVQGSQISSFRSDFREPLASRDGAYRNPVTPLFLKPGVNRIYIRLDTDWLVDTVALRLWTQEDFTAHRTTENLVQGIIIGIFLLLYFYALSITLFVRDKSFLYLSFLVLSQLFIHLCFSGFGFQYLWPGYPQLGISLLYLLFPCQYTANILLVKSFIGTGVYKPGINVLLQGMISFFFFLPLLALVLPGRMKWMVLAVLLSAEYLYYIPLVIVSFTAWKKGIPGALLPLIGLCLIPLSQIEWGLSNNNVIPFELINYLHIKGISYILLMTIALTNTIKNMKKSLDTVNSTMEKTIRERIDRFIAEEYAKRNQKTLTDTTKAKIEETRKYIRNHFTEEISREDLADAIGISPDHLGRMFKRYTGEKVADYINKCRIEYAAKQLLESDEKIIDIAFATGFSSLRTFNSLFKTIMRQTPTEYRKELHPL